MPEAFEFEISINRDRVIRGSLFPARSKPMGTLIICHGYKGFKNWGMFPYIGESLSEDLHVITFNFSHNGVGENGSDFTELEKFARNTYSRELEDLRLLIASIRQGTLPVSMDLNLQSMPLFLLGHSRGAGVSLIYTFDYPDHIDGVVSWNGITDVDIFSEDEKKAMREHGRAYIENARTQQQMPLDLEIIEDISSNVERFNMMQRVVTCKVPIVLIQASEDFERLRNGSAELVKRNPSVNWVIIPGGNHTFGSVHPFQGATEPLEAAIVHTKRFIHTVLSSTLHD